MRTRLRHGLSVAVVSVICTLMCALPAFAADVAGRLEGAGDTTISGWALDKDNPDKSAEVVLYVYTDGTMDAKELAKVKADQYRTDLAENLGNGNHSFSYTVNWDALEGTNFIVEAYVVSGEEQIRLSGSPQYSKKEAVPVEAKAVKAAAGPAGDTVAAPPSDAAVVPTPAVGKGVTGKKGASLGSFVTTAYCNCTKCSSGHNLTYSGTVPVAKHTISADIDYYPIGTKLMIGDIIYTVEDIGSGVNGKCLDIFFDTHQQALSYGRKTVEVFAVD